jgi:hypothetical protein
LGARCRKRRASQDGRRTKKAALPSHGLPPSDHRREFSGMGERFWGFVSCREAGSEPCEWLAVTGVAVEGEVCLGGASWRGLGGIGGGLELLEGVREVAALDQRLGLGTQPLHHRFRWSSAGLDRWPVTQKTRQSRVWDGGFTSRVWERETGREGQGVAGFGSCAMQEVPCVRLNRTPSPFVAPQPTGHRSAASPRRRELGLWCFLPGRSRAGLPSS